MTITFLLDNKSHSMKGLDIVYPVMGEDFVLNCSYSANPSVTAEVIWYKNGNPVDFHNTPHKNITQDGAVMQILKCEKPSQINPCCLLKLIFSQPPVHQADFTVVGSSMKSGAARSSTWPQSMWRTSQRSS